MEVEAEDDSLGEVTLAACGLECVLKLSWSLSLGPPICVFLRRASFARRLSAGEGEGDRRVGFEVFSVGLLPVRRSAEVLSSSALEAEWCLRI